MDYTRKIIIKSLAWKFFERCSVQITSFFVSVILARMLPPSDFGLVAIIMIFINLSNVIIDGGLNSALIQKKNATKKDFSTILSSCLFLSFIIYVLLFIASPIISDFYNYDELTTLLRALGLILFFYSINSIQMAYIARNMLFNKLFQVSLVSVIISGTVGLYMAYLGFGVWSLVSQIMLNQIVTTFFSFKVVKWKFEFKFYKKNFVELFNYGWKIFLTNFVTTLFSNVRGLIIGKQYTPEALAFFDRGQQLPNLLLGNLLSSIQSIMFPVFSSAQDEKEKVKLMVRRSIKTTCMIAFPLLVGLFVLCDSLVLLLFTEKWSGAILFLRIFCIAQILMPIQIINIQAIMSLGFSDIILRMELRKKIIEVVILAVSVFGGVEAIAWGVVLYNAVCIYINLSPNRKLLGYGIREQIVDVAPTFLISVFMGAFIYIVGFLSFGMLMLLFIQILCGVIFYLVSCYIFKVESFFYILNIVTKRI